ncbi:grainyhead-like protein 2 homolog [Acropora muricata]|uniref:grainyhead-like protein 2 homolog n=1 Tax=Acropora millepora TaxID=45264 RepID=UPI0010FCCEB5|nr:grainyhead-like protein 2 homolog [Acropora millepora]
MADTARRKSAEVTVNMAGKVTSEGNTIVITSGSPAKSVGSPSSDGGRDVRDDRTWKAYVSQLDSPISSALLVNGEDLNMAAGLGFLYDYYEVTEESNQGPASPSNQGSSGGSTGHGNSSSGNNLSNSGNSDSESGSPSQSEQATLTFLQAVQQIKAPKHSSATVQSEHGAHNITPKQEKISPVVKTLPIGQQIKVQPSTSSCSHTTISVGRSSAYPVSNKSPSHQAQVSDVSPLSLSTTPPEGFNFSAYSQSLKSTPTVFSAQDKYTFILEAPTSIIQRRGDDTLTYLNKGQFYTISFEGNVDPQSSDGEIQRVKSIVHLVFRDEKDPRSECEHWQYWHSQQPNPQQRAFDIDRKSCQNIEENIDEIAYNAAGFTWSPHLNAKIVIRINCLSTDFSSQKGVKGIPLHLQIDTYEDIANADAEPVHRSFCQIKVFRDKGAERKNKDESKSAEKRIQKWVKQNTSACPDPNMVSPTTLFHPPSKYTQLQTTTPLGPKPILFTPSVHSPHSSFEESSLQTLSLMASIKDRENKRTLQSHLALAKDELAELEVVPRLKVQRIHRPNRPAVTIYVKKEEEKVYNALMLDSLTVGDMVEAVASKYGMPPEMIKNVYKKTKKGILVNMDDRMIEQFVDEDDFIINLDFDNQLGHFELTLQY